MMVKRVAVKRTTKNTPRKGSSRRLSSDERLREEQRPQVSSAFVAVDLGATSGPSRFYRVRLVP